VECPKCRHENPEVAQFCVRCHATLRYFCPACKREQFHGGKCDQCGVDFAKYGAMLVFKAADEAARQREGMKKRASLARQIALLPVTGGLSLLKYLLSRLRGD